MSTILYTEINIVGAVLLLLLLNNINRSGFKDMPFDQQIFNNIMIINLLIFIFDTGMWLLDGKPGPVCRLGNYMATTIYYLLNPLMCFLWLMYTDFKIFESRLDLLRRARFYAIPVVASSIMSLASPFTKWFFVIDEGNRYMRGPLFWVMAFLSFSYLAASCFIPFNDCCKDGWEKNKSVNLYLTALSIFIMAAAVAQTMFYGVSVIWICTMIACVSTYINIQNREISTDHLTGLFNRRRFDQHLQQRIRARRENRLLFAVMLDLDEFKSINDNHGHNAGDKALVQTAEMLRQICRDNDDFVARLGGDEFVIVGERDEHAEIEQLMEKINTYASDYNQRSQWDFKLQLSMGYAVYGKDDTADTFLAAADREMYRIKKERKLG